MWQFAAFIHSEFYNDLETRFGVPNMHDIQLSMKVNDLKL